MRLGTSAIYPMVSAMLLAACLPAAVGAVERLPTFDEIYQSRQADELTAWGRRYERGVGIPRDTKKAVKLYCKAAANGDRDAKFYLGQLLAFGRGIARDTELAAAWLQAAAAAGDERSRNMLMVLNVGEAPTRGAVCPRGGGGGDVTRIASRSHPARGAIANLVRQLAPGYGLDADLVLAVIETESNFNPNARSPKNAQGLMQLIPATAARFGVADAWDPEQNIRGGMAYLSWLLKHFDGNIELALAGYNAGEGAVERHGGIPPYRETRNYVSRIIARIN